MTYQKHSSIEAASNYLAAEMKKHDKSYDGEVKDVELNKEQIDKQTMEWIRLALSDSGYPSRECKERLKKYMKELNTMENNKVRQFIDLLLNGDTVENAVKTSGVESMKLHDLCVAISGMEYVNTLESLVSHAKEAIQTVKDLDNALVDLKKNGKEE